MSKSKKNKSQEENQMNLNHTSKLDDSINFSPQELSISAKYAHDIQSETSNDPLYLNDDTELDTFLAVFDKLKETNTSISPEEHFVNLCMSRLSKKTPN